MPISGQVVDPRIRQAFGSRLQTLRDKNTAGSTAPRTGMFQSGGPQTFTPTPPMFGPQAFDVSGISRGMEEFEKAPRYKPQGFQPFQYSVPQYGQTSPQEMQNIYEQGFGVAARPVMAQSKERMRQMSQGFEGGRFTGAAQREAAMREGQEAGAGIQDIAAGLGSQLSHARLGEMQEARRAQFGAELDRQRQQAEEQYRAAGFTDEQARYLAQEGLQRAQSMMGWGFQLPQLQNQLSQSQLQGFSNILGQLGSLGGI